MYTYGSKGVDFVNTQDFGKFISELRKEKGLTQLQLAEKLNVTDKAVSRWETGKNFPDIDIFSDLAKILEVSVSELLEGKRIEKEELIVVSEENVVKQIKKNKKSKKIYSSIIAVILILTLTFGYFALRNNGVFDGVIYHEFPCYSNDLVTMMNTLEGYIISRPKASKEFMIDGGYFFLNSDKTSTTAFYLSGTCDNGRYFYINTSYDPADEENNFFIGELRENRNYTQGITFDELEKIITQLDLSLLRECEKYEIEIGALSTLYNSDLELNDFQKGLKKFIFTKDGILKPYTERYLSGTYFSLYIMACNGAHGQNCGYILCER